MKINRFARVFWQPISRFNILLSGIYSFMWGLWVATPTWDVFNRSPIYESLNWAGSELIWGGVQMLVGIALVFAAFDNIHWMKWATFAGFVSWMLVSLGFAFSDWHNPGMWVAGFISATNAYMFLNTAKQANET
jgi:hypothetical protein